MSPFVTSQILYLPILNGSGGPINDIQDLYIDISASDESFFDT